MRLVMVSLAIGLIMTTLAEVRADDKPYGVGFAAVGQAIQEIKDQAKTDGRRLYCDGDKEPSVSNGDREILRVTDAQAAAGLTRCQIFAKDESGTWSSRRVGVAGQPADFIILGLDDNGVRKILQIQAYQPKENWDSTVKALTLEYGTPGQMTAVATQWHNGVSDIVLARVQDGFWIYMSDLRLQKAMRERLGLPDKK